MEPAQNWVNKYTQMKEICTKLREMYRLHLLSNENYFLEIELVIDFLSNNQMVGHKLCCSILHDIRALGSRLLMISNIYCNVQSFPVNLESGLIHNSLEAVVKGLTYQSSIPQWIECGTSKQKVVRSIANAQH